VEGCAHLSSLRKGRVQAKSRRKLHLRYTGI
jgi:hypothetical protein